MKNSLIISSTLAIAFLGAGCQLPSSQTGAATPTSKPAETPKLARANGFGKLPTLEAAAQTNDTARSSAAVSNVAPTTPSAAPKTAGATESAIAGRPIPIPPPPQTPGTVSYDVTASIPTWNAEDDVLRTRSTNFPSSQISLLAQATGLPTQALGSDAKAQSLSFSWIDADGFTWTYDAVQRNVSFWKQDTRVYANAEPSKTTPTIDDAAFIKIAEAFLASKGFGGVPHATGVVEKPWGDVATINSVRMPCPLPMMGGAVKAEAGGTVTVESAQTAPSIAPGEYYPCWYPQQVSVTFGAVRNGRNINDASGSPFTNLSVTIDITSKAVLGGSAWLDQDVDGSRYQLIDRDTAIKRLKAGGRNPIWPWGSGTDIAVKITSVDLVWMRYDSWDEKSGTATYFIPALAGSGTVEYAKDNVQQYRTIVPLVADDAFEPVKSPGPVPLQGASGGGSAGVAPAGTGTIAPKKQ